MLCLPGEMVEHVGNYLDIYSLTALKVTCKYLDFYLERLYQKMVNLVPWRIVIHVLDSKDSVTISDVWISIGDYKPYLIDQKTENTLNGDICLTSFYNILPYEECHECSNITAYEDVYIHGGEHVNCNQIHTIIKEGVGGETIKTILELMYKHNGDVCVEFKEKWYYDGLIDEPSLSDSCDSLEISYDVFMPVDKKIISDVDMVSIRKYSTSHIKTSDYTCNYSSKIVYGMYTLYPSDVLHYNPCLGDYDLDNYRDGVMMDTSEDGEDEDDWEW